MTWAEAVAAMERGDKVTRRAWTRGWGNLEIGDTDSGREGFDSRITILCSDPEGKREWDPCPGYLAICVGATDWEIVE